MHYFIILLPLPYLGLAYLAERVFAWRRAAAAAAIAATLACFGLLDVRFFRTVIHDGGAPGDYGIAYRYQQQAVRFMRGAATGRRIVLGTDLSFAPAKRLTPYRFLLWNADPAAAGRTGRATKAFVLVDGFRAPPPLLRRDPHANSYPRAAFGPLTVVELPPPAALTDAGQLPHSRVQRGEHLGGGDRARPRAAVRPRADRHRRRLDRRHRRDPGRDCRENGFGRRPASAEPGQGRCHPRGDPASDRRDRRRPGRRSRIRPRRRSRTDRSDHARVCRRRLRLAALGRPAAARLPVLAHGRQQVPQPRDRDAVQHHALRHGDGVQGVSDRRLALARSPPGRLRDRARDHGEGVQEAPPHLRDPGRVLRPHVFRGQEDHVARRHQGAPRPRPDPIRRAELMRQREDALRQPTATGARRTCAGRTRAHRPEVLRRSRRRRRDGHQQAGRQREGQEGSTLRHRPMVRPRGAQRANRRADAGTRTPDPIITSDVLYQLSYVGRTRAV